MNPLFSDRDVAFVLDVVLRTDALLRLPWFKDHSRETFAMVIDNARRLARDVLYPSYRPVDEAPPVFKDGRVFAHPKLEPIYKQLVELGLAAATRSYDVGGQQLPVVVSTIATAYLMAGNLSAFSYLGLTSGAGHLLEVFGTPEQRKRYMEPLYRGEWAGTMALTEPQAGSSLSDVKTRATPQADGSFLLSGSKIFISAGDHDLTENVVHMALARIDGAPAGIKGVSLFVVPKLRPGADGKLVPNDVSVTGLIHKIGYRGVPSLALSFGERGECRGELVGPMHKGISCMFQMMNEARIMVGMNGVATAAVAYQEALAYAKERPQGRAVTARDPKTAQVPIIEHADVRRMLLRQKAIVEGGFALVSYTALQADLAAHGESEEARHRAGLLLDLLTPLAKSFPAEWGFEANALAVQVHGGYGYSSEYLPEAWMRDQKLNSIHEGTTGIQGMDLLGRKVVAEGGAALRVLCEEVASGIARARAAGVDASLCDEVERFISELVPLTMELATHGLEGRVDQMLRHSTHYLQLVCIGVVAWQWLVMAAGAEEERASKPEDAAFFDGKVSAAKYWIRTELPKASSLIGLVRTGDDSYAAMKAESF